MFSKVKKYIKKLKIGKHQLDWVAGALSIPVLLTVIILNLNNLKIQKSNSLPVAQPKPTEKIILVPQNNSSPVVQQNTSSVCKKEVGPISITTPKENETVSENPVCINIKYADSNYCSVVWSYKINNGSGSDYNSNSPCLYNLPNGNVKFELRIQSTVSQDTDSLIRNFNYLGTNPTSTPSSSF